MLLRISLIVAILTGVGALYFGHFKVAEKIDTLTTDLKSAQDARATAEDGQRKAQQAERKAKTELEATRTALGVATNSLVAMTARANQQEARANKASADYDKAATGLHDAEQKLAAWDATGVTPNQIDDLKARLRSVTDERDAYVEEKKVLLRNNNQLKNELAKWAGDTETEVKLPPGLKGKVIAVDPKWEFVVLNIGANDGVLENGKMLIDRDGKLVGKVRIMSVEAKRSIANILPAWKQTAVREGDEVLY